MLALCSPQQHKRLFCMHLLLLPHMCPHCPFPPANTVPRPSPPLDRMYTCRCRSGSCRPLRVAWSTRSGCWRSTSCASRYAEIPTRAGMCMSWGERVALTGRLHCPSLGGCRPSSQAQCIACQIPLLGVALEPQWLVLTCASPAAGIPVHALHPAPRVVAVPMPGSLGRNRHVQGRPGPRRGGPRLPGVPAGGHGGGWGGWAGKGGGGWAGKGGGGWAGKGEGGQQQQQRAAVSMPHLLLHMHSFRGAFGRPCRPAWRPCDPG